MRKQCVTQVATLWAAGLLLLPTPMLMADSVADSFRGHDPDSKFRINYGDVDAILDAMVLVTDRSGRDSAYEPTAPTGTRMKTGVSRSTGTEGNRFYFEQFSDNQEYRALLHQVRLSLEAIPGTIPLEYFSRDEQLAYWLNLHNITLIDELVRIYPERNLKQELKGKNSILEDKTLRVAGVALSLNDIRYTILFENYGNPLVMYGLFEGTIGGPNVRNKAYAGDRVYRQLESNAAEFINSNRGAEFYKSDIFKVSSLYERHAQYFPNFERHLKVHLLDYMDYPERRRLMAATTFRPTIDNWTIADIHGTYRRVGGSFSTNPAALQDAVVSTQPDGEGGTVATNASAASSILMAKAPPISTIDLQQLELLDMLRNKEEAANLLRQGRVIVEELGTVEDDSQ